MCQRVTRQFHTKYFLILLTKHRNRQLRLLPFKVVDASESNGATNPTEIFHTPQVSQNLRNNAKPWFQTEILSMM
jgi:hypothetical protein